MGSYMEHLTAKDEAAKDRLMKGLAGFLDRDRTLFDLSPKPVSSTKTTSSGSEVCLLAAEVSGTLWAWEVGQWTTPLQVISPFLYDLNHRL